jgi:DNA invertase Pin-like site-specific DNA recombinase
LDRLARNVKDLLTIVETITNKGATVEFIKEHLTFSPSDTNPISNLMLQILGSIAEFERSLIKGRQLQGIAIAKAKGKFKGGKKKLTDAQVAELKELALSRTPITSIAKKFKISRPCVYSYIKA